MPNELEFLIYKTPEEDIKINALFNDETLWLSQAGMAQLFDSSKSNISEHLTNIFNEGELDKDMAMRKFGISEFSSNATKPTNFYNIDAIISVGYRVNSRRATQFRIWATNVLKEYIKKGFVLDDERLKQGERVFGKDYFSLNDRLVDEDTDILEYEQGCADWGIRDCDSIEKLNSFLESLGEDAYGYAFPTEESMEQSM